MRPRVFPAEDAQSGAPGEPDDQTASMRPRVFPAEDLVDLVFPAAAFGGFNEAAGIPRGRQKECETCHGAGILSLQ